MKGEGRHNPRHELRGLAEGLDPAEAVSIRELRVAGIAWSKTLSEIYDYERQRGASRDPNELKRLDHTAKDIFKVIQEIIVEQARERGPQAIEDLDKAAARSAEMNALLPLLKADVRRAVREHFQNHSYPVHESAIPPHMQKLAWACFAYAEAMDSLRRESDRGDDQDKNELRRLSATINQNFELIRQIILDQAGTERRGKGAWNDLETTAATLPEVQPYVNGIKQKIADSIRKNLSKK